MRDLPELLAPGDLVVVNDSRVIPARLRLHRRSGGAVEVLLLEALDAEHRRWECLVRPARRLERGEELVDDRRPCRRSLMGSRTEAGDTFTVELCADDPLAAIDAAGQVPLPPYITAPLADPARYQTVYATRAGLRRGPDRRPAPHGGGARRADGRSVGLARVELVVGLDTFQPVSEDDPTRAPHPQRAVRGAGRDSRGLPWLRRGWLQSERPWRAPSSRLPRPGRPLAGPGCSSTARTSGGWSTC